MDTAHVRSAEVRPAAPAEVCRTPKVRTAATTTTMVLGVRQGRCCHGGESEEKRPGHGAKTSHNCAVHGSCLRREHHPTPRGILITKLDLRRPRPFKLKAVVRQEARFE
jgi:hypothetical protein